MTEMIRKYWCTNYFAYAPEEMKVTAREITSRAIARGDLIRPSKCDICNLDRRKIHSHHLDYRHPMDIAWLCSSCHATAHRAANTIRRTKNRKAAVSA